MHTILTFGFLLMGFSFTVTQGLLIRELLVAFFGNELSIGLILGSWLLLEAVGSGLLGRISERWGKKASSFAVLQVLFALFLPLCLYGASVSRRMAGAITGEGVGLVPIFWSSFLILAPLALVDGAMFAFGCQVYAHLTGRGVPSIGRVYVYEAIGAIAGGVLFTYVFIPLLYSLQIVLLLSALNLLSAAFILASFRSPNQVGPRLTPGLAVVIAMLAASLGLLLLPQAKEIQRWLAGQQWVGYDLVYSENSVYGNVAVVQRQDQFTFFADGIPILNAPVPDVALSEEIVHLPMLFVPHQPRSALVLSGGLGGVLHELAKYPLERVDYAELDPLLIDAVRQFPTPLTEAELSDPRVTVEHMDGRLLVRRKQKESVPHTDSEEGYDLVIVNLPYPSTLQLNRFYTVEFFQMVRRLLAEDGVLVIRCPGTLTYMSDELRDLNNMVYHTLREAFPYVRPIPGEVTLWLASASAEFATVPVETLVERWERRSLETALLSPAHIRLKLNPLRLDWLWNSLAAEEGRREVVVNRDLHPVGLFYGLSYWNAIFSPHVARALAFIGQLNVWALGPPIVGCVLFLVVVISLTGRGKSVIVPIAIVTTGFTGMTADLIIVFAFQTLYGYVYYRIGLIITAFLAGLSLGALLMTKRSARSEREGFTLLKLELALILYWCLLPIVLFALHSHSIHPRGLPFVQEILLLLNVLAGFLVGAQFPVANRMWLQDRESLRGSAGVLYACDLVGAFLGAVVVSVALVPALGILDTCLLVAMLKLGSLALVAVLVLRT